MFGRSSIYISWYIAVLPLVYSRNLVFMYVMDLRLLGHKYFCCGPQQNE